MNKKKKLIVFGAAGAGTIVAGYLVYRALNKRSGSTGLKGEPKLTPLNAISTSASSGEFGGTLEIPALGIIHDSNGDYIPYALNYTPQADPADNSRISVEDYERLQTVGLIPQGFPHEQIVAVPSHNGRNWFFVGYSAPFSMPTNRDDLTVIQPLWAVSYGQNFDSSATPPDNFPDEEGFRDVALRTLFSEWMLTNRGVDGCHRGQTLSACNAERAAILNLILQRTYMKQSRIRDNLSYASVIYGPGIRWNGSTQFMTSYEGPITARARDRFEAFYNTAFWQMPQYSGNAVGFIHPYGMSRGGMNPSWIKNAQPLDANFGPYLANHTVKLGSAVFSDIRRTFK